MNTYQLNITDGDEERGTDTMWINAKSMALVQEYLNRHPEIKTDGTITLIVWTWKESGVDVIIGE